MTDRIGYLEGNCHVERRFQDGNVTVEKPASSPERLEADQYYMRLVNDKPDCLMGRPIISKTFHAICVPSLGKTVVVRVKMAALCQRM